MRWKPAKSFRKINSENIIDKDCFASGLAAGIEPHSSSIRFAVIALLKTIDIGRNHLIHRKRSLSPEKTEWRVKSEE